jgi:hypothetical protein
MAILWGSEAGYQMGMWTYAALYLGVCAIEYAWQAYNAPPACNGNTSDPTVCVG